MQKNSPHNGRLFASIYKSAKPYALDLNNKIDAAIKAANDSHQTASVLRADSKLSLLEHGKIAKQGLTKMKETKEWLENASSYLAADVVSFDNKVSRAYAGLDSTTNYLIARDFKADTSASKFDALKNDAVLLGALRSLPEYVTGVSAEVINGAVLAHLKANNAELATEYEAIEQTNNLLKEMNTTGDQLTNEIARVVSEAEDVRRVSGL